jgi:predicted metal-binding protein
MKPLVAQKPTRTKRISRIGILLCSNTARVLDCPAGACLRDMYDRKGAFARYKDQDVELVGIISCNGCPTLKGEDVILPRIEALLHYGAVRIHLAYCLMILCPFVKKYVKVIKANYPSVDLIEGTHEPHQADIEFRCAVAAMLRDRTRTIIP